MKIKKKRSGIRNFRQYLQTTVHIGQQHARLPLSSLHITKTSPPLTRKQTTAASYVECTSCGQVTSAKDVGRLNQKYCDGFTKRVS